MKSRVKSEFLQKDNLKAQKIVIWDIPTYHFLIKKFTSLQFHGLWRFPKYQEWDSCPDNLAAVAPSENYTFDKWRLKGRNWSWCHLIKGDLYEVVLLQISSFLRQEKDSKEKISLLKHSSLHLPLNICWEIFDETLDFRDFESTWYVAQNVAILCMSSPPKQRSVNHQCPHCLHHCHGWWGVEHLLNLLSPRKNS